MSEPIFLVRSIDALLRSFAYRATDEMQLQEAIAQALRGENLVFVREQHLDEKSRPDFMVAGGVAIEVKIRGSFSEAFRQVDRYCVFREVTGCVLASTEAWARKPLRSKPTLRGKPFAMVHLARQAL